MEQIITLLIFISMILITIITLTIFSIRKKENNYEKIIIQMNEETEQNKELLKKYNKEKDELELKIKEKKLDLKLIKR